MYVCIYVCIYIYIYIYVSTVARAHPRRGGWRLKRARAAPSRVKPQ